MKNKHSEDLNQLLKQIYYNEENLLALDVLLNCRKISVQNLCLHSSVGDVPCISNAQKEKHHFI